MCRRGVRLMSRRRGRTCGRDEVSKLRRCRFDTPSGSRGLEVLQRDTCRSEGYYALVKVVQDVREEKRLHG